MTEAAKQKRTPCPSCPFMAEGGDRTSCFKPEALEQTVVHYLRNGGIHPCHKNQEYMCAGYLSFAEQALPQGAVELQMVRISERLGMFDWGLVDDGLPVFESVEEMLENHAARSFLSSPAHEDEVAQ